MFNKISDLILKRSEAARRTLLDTKKSVSSQEVDGGTLVAAYHVVEICKKAAQEVSKIVGPHRLAVGLRGIRVQGPFGDQPGQKPGPRSGRLLPRGDEFTGRKVGGRFRSLPAEPATIERPGLRRSASGRRAFASAQPGSS